MEGGRKESCIRGRGVAERKGWAEIGEGREEERIGWGLVRGRGGIWGAERSEARSVKSWKE